MKLKEVVSSAIHAYGYNEPSESLWIVFNSATDKVYEYTGVPSEVFASFESTDSFGRFVAKEIKPHYSVTVHDLADVSATLASLPDLVDPLPDSTEADKAGATLLLKDMGFSFDADKLVEMFVAVQKALLVKDQMLLFAERTNELSPSDLVILKKVIPDDLGNFLHIQDMLKGI